MKIIGISASDARNDITQTNLKEATLANGWGMKNMNEYQKQTMDEEQRVFSNAVKKLGAFVAMNFHNWFEKMYAVQNYEEWQTAYQNGYIEVFNYDRKRLEAKQKALENATIDDKFDMEIG